MRDSDASLWEPTEHAPWKDRARAQEFCEHLRKRTGRPYQLARAPEGPGLGVRPDPGCLCEYLRPVRIDVGGGALDETPGM